LEFSFINAKLLLQALQLLGQLFSHQLAVNFNYRSLLALSRIPLYALLHSFLTTLLERGQTGLCCRKLTLKIVCLQSEVDRGVGTRQAALERSRLLIDLIDSFLENCDPLLAGLARIRSFGGLLGRWPNGSSTRLRDNGLRRRTATGFVVPTDLKAKREKKENN
jgi:hypothetical protein